MLVNEVEQLFIGKINILARGWEASFSSCRGVMKLRRRIAAYKSDWTRDPKVCQRQVAPPDKGNSSNTVLYACRLWTDLASIKW